MLSAGWNSKVWKTRGDQTLPARPIKSMRPERMPSGFTLEARMPWTFV